MYVCMYLDGKERNRKIPSAQSVFDFVSPCLVTGGDVHTHVGAAAPGGFILYISLSLNQSGQVRSGQVTAYSRLKEEVFFCFFRFVRPGSRCI